MASEVKKRKVQIISPSSSLSNSLLESCDPSKLDWNLCFICQSNNKFSLQDPSNNPLGKHKQNPDFVKKSYISLADNITALNEIEGLPLALNPILLNDKITLWDYLYENRAKYHKNCKKHFDDDKVKRAIKRHQKDDNEKKDDLQRKKSSRNINENVDKLCFFCEKKEDQKRVLHKVQTMTLDKKVRKAAIELNDTILHAKLQNGDMAAQDALYHSDCLCKIYREAQQKRYGEEVSDEYRKVHGLAFSKVISFIDETVLSAEDGSVPLFKLSDLSKCYSETLETYGIVGYKAHSTRFKYRIMACYEDMFEERSGRDIILGFRRDLADVIESAKTIDYDHEGSILAEACKILRRDLLSMKNTEFDGSFEKNCQEDVIPNSLKCLLSSILHGTRLTNPHYKQSILTIGQLIRFNTLRSTRKDSSSMYHSKEREPPISIFLSQFIHSRTRDLTAVDTFARLGLGISKERLLQLSTALGNSVIDTFAQDGVVVPLSLEKGHFCTSAIDNIDVNPKATHSKTSLHGTAASINVHPILESGILRNTVSLDFTKQKLQNLPNNYTDIVPFQLPSIVTPQLLNVDHKEDAKIEDELLNADCKWLESTDTFSWSVFHARRELMPRKLIEDSSALLPIWRDDSKSPATIRHALRVLMRAIEFLNPGQTPVCTLDQPLFALAKSIQWFLPDEFGSDKLVLILGSLHVEMATLSALGDLLTGSGWLQLTANSNVTGSGNNYLLTGKNVATTKYIHQVTAMVLSNLLRTTYDESDEKNKLDFFTWRSEMEKKNPLFQYWSLVLKLEMSFLLFIRSIRHRSFDLYRYSIHQLLPWMFSLDHFHYARWLSVHAFDMDNLAQTNPNVFIEFNENGNFVVARTLNKFSSMGIDQRHEQLNADVKGTGGAIGLTEDEDKLLRWMVCGPEEARLVREFKRVTLLNNDNEDLFRHHEDSPSFKSKFIHDVKSLEKEFRKVGHPFLPGSADLINIETNDVMSEDVINSVKNIEKIGKKQTESFFEMLRKKPSNFNEPIKKNKLPLMSQMSQCVKNKPSKVHEIKEHLHLFSELYVASQIRGADMTEFFSHETLTYPPSLSSGGELRSGNKSDMTPIITSLVKASIDSKSLCEMPHVDGVVIDGPVILQQIKPAKNITVDQYAQEYLYPYITKYKNSTQAKRVDIIYDTYPTISLKSTVREKRGIGVRRKVVSGTMIPANWKAFLRSSENKVELFKFLSIELSRISNQKIISAYDDTTTLQNNHQFITPSDHEEADTRIFLHAMDMSQKGLKNLMIRTVDTDVLVLSASLFIDLSLESLWIDFGSGKHRCFIPIHELSLDPIKRKGLRFFYCFTGCDQVSFFAHVTKKTAWKIWQVFPQANEVFQALCNEPTEEYLKEILPLIERFTILLYDRTSNCSSVNECRRELFCKGRVIENIPPSQAALFQHLKRAAFIAGFVWRNSFRSLMHLPPFTLYGYNANGTPFWTDLPEASRGVRELKKVWMQNGLQKTMQM